MTLCRSRLLFLLAMVVCGCARERPWPPGVQKVSDSSPVLTPADALKTFFLPPGYAIELVASEPLVRDPVAIDFDADGRMWVVEMRGYMPTIDGTGEDAPVGRIVVLEDGNDDGRMDTSRVYLDGLVLPRAVKVLEAGVLVGAPPFLWLTRDTNGDGRADVKEIVRDDYGDPGTNPEHNANGLLWALDNWIYNARYDGRFRVNQGRVIHERTLRRGQWGLSMDDYGRLFRNSNEDPLRVDLVADHYFTRNPNAERTRGVYEQTVTDQTVWPVRPTPGVNRGYRERVLRPDGTLAQFTAAGSPVVYRGDRLPGELLNNVFITEPAGNLVRRFVIEEARDGALRARNAYERAEFLASTDERFRPVNLSSAPDGTLYVVDMYRGIIQHRFYQTDYLKHYIRTHRLEAPIGYGRIYRIVHRSTTRGRRPRLSRAARHELVAALSHPNGWWRDTAQRLIVERFGGTARFDDADQLHRLVLTPRDERARMHALWTLHGLGLTRPATLPRALGDPSPHVRVAALRIAEAFLGRGDATLSLAVLKRIADTDPRVRRQLAASMGALPPGEREDALAALLARHGSDPIVVDAAVSGLHGSELAFVDRLRNDRVWIERAVDPGGIMKMLAAAVMRGGKPDEMQQVLDWIGEEQAARWQRLALLDGVDMFVPDSDASDGDARMEAVELRRKPAGLLAAAASTDHEIRTRAQDLAKLIRWPDKPKEQRPAVPPLSAEDRQRFAQGSGQYRSTCAPCHQPDGRGISGQAPPLVGSKWVLGPPARLARIILHGKEGAQMMPPLNALTDDQIASVLTYVRRAWGHQGGPVNPALVTEVRGYTTGRNRPWTEQELSQVRQ